MRRLLVIAFALCLAACGQKTILVQGDGVIRSQADYARITATTVTRADSVKSAVAQSNKRTRAILDGLKAAGLAAASFGARHFNVGAACDYNASTRRYVCKGFKATNDVVVEVSDLSEVGQVLGLVSALGADEIGSPDFEARDEPSLAAQARRLAIANAKTQAESYIRGSGWRLGKMIAVESSSAIGSQYSRFRYLKELQEGGSVMGASPSANADLIAERVGAVVPVTASQITTVDSVFVEYKIVGAWNLFGDKTWW